MLVSGAAMADDAYAGISIMTPGEAQIGYGAAGKVDNYNNPSAFKLYGGLGLGQGYALEAGYGDFGSWKFRNPANTSLPEASIKSDVFYLAGKKTLPLSEDFSIYGKLGVARNHLKAVGFDGQTTSDSSIRPMVGIGADYRIYNNLSAVLEFEYYGKTKGAAGSYTQQKLGTGLKYSF